MKPHNDTQTVASRFLMKGTILNNFSFGMTMVILNQFLIAIQTVIVVAISYSGY